MRELKTLIEGLYQDALVLRREVHDIIERARQMASIHDQIRDVLSEAKGYADVLIGTGKANDAANVDLLTQAQALRDELKAAGSSAPASDGSTMVTVAGPVTAPSTTVPVVTSEPVVVGSTVDGPGVASGTTVVASDASSVALSQPTTDDHTGGETLKVTPPAA